MNQRQYKEKLYTFHASCRVYRYEKQQVMLIPVQVSANEPLTKQLNTYLIEDVQLVESMFTKIRDICGPGAAAKLWMVFVEEKTQEDVAYQMGMTTRALQYSIDKWLHMVFAEEENG